MPSWLIFDVRPMKEEHLQFLSALEDKLRAAPRFRIVAAGTTGHAAPQTSGVYAVWDRTNRGAVYVGESCNLNHRIGDFTKPKKHRVWSILSDMPDALLADAEKLEVSWIYDFIGRRELEEFLNIRWFGKVPRRFFTEEAAQMRNWPNKAPEPTTMAVTPRATSCILK